MSTLQPLVDGWTRRLFFGALPSWLVSMVVHVLLLMLLALVTFGGKPPVLLHEFTMRAASPDELREFEDATELDLPKLEIEIQPLHATNIADAEPTLQIDAPAAIGVEATVAAPATDTIDPLGELAVIEGIFEPTSGVPTTADPFSQRQTPAGRLNQAQRRGGNRESEQAVARALQWIISRQAADGGWNFNHNASLNPRPCPDIGAAERARNGATAIAILPLLGAGQTHKQGVYQKQVQAGLNYLVAHLHVSGRTGSWHEADGSMYSHGLASIAVCEAYAMTHDRELLAPAQLAINYIVAAQDPVGGGWRYEPQQAGDTSVVGWQLMALKSGHLAYLAVPKETIAGVNKFLDSVQANSGAEYGYTSPASGRDSTTGIGLLCRMYLGWKRDTPALARGIDIIDRRGPSTTDMYYNYYATQVCCQFDGEPWLRWNARMRDWLIKSQSTAGVTAGSWHMAGGHANERGGRLYCTALAAMILEVYYRQMPLYQQQAADDDFAF